MNRWSLDSSVTLGPDGLPRLVRSAAPWRRVDLSAARDNKRNRGEAPSARLKRASANLPWCLCSQHHAGGSDRNKPLPPFIPVPPPQSEFAPSIFNRDSMMTDVSHISYGQAYEQPMLHGATLEHGAAARGNAGQFRSQSPRSYGPSSLQPPNHSQPAHMRPGSTAAGTLTRRNRVRADEMTQEQIQQRLIDKQWAKHRSSKPDCSCTHCCVHRERQV